MLHKNIYSFFVATAICLSIVFLNFSRPVEFIMSWDQFGYYLYLPLSFIYHDLHISDFGLIEDLMHKYQPVQYFYQGMLLDNGHWMIRYTSGLAILYSPGFFAGHFFAWLLDYPMDGFSFPYQLSMLAWAILFLSAGIFILRKTLLHFFSDGLAATVLLLFYFGTNFMLLSSRHGIMLVHPFLFTVFASLIWFTIRWHKNYKVSSAVMIGLCLGIAAITRPTEALYVLIPVLWNVRGWKSFKDKWTYLLKNHLSQALLIAAIIFLLALVQFSYWKYVSGHFLFDSYSSNPGEGFDFPPYLLEFLFSYRKGWLLYTPMMFLAIGGLVVLYKQKRELFLPIFIFLTLFLLVVSSWTYWWYASCFSQRTMTQIYPLLAIPMGYSLQWLSQRKTIKMIGGFLILLLLALNLFQSWQYDNNIIHGERMTRRYYWAAFLKTAIPENAEELLLVARDEVNPKLNSTAGLHKELLFQKTFKDTILQLSDSGGVPSVTGRLVPLEQEFAELYDVRIKQIMNRDYAWCRVHIKYVPLSEAVSSPSGLVINVLHKTKPYGYRTYDLFHDSIKIGSSTILTVEYLTPEIRNRTWNRFQVYLWNRGRMKLLIQEVRIELFEPIEDP